MNDEKAAKIEEFFTRGVGEFIDPEGSFKKKLIEKIEGKNTKPIIIKFGVDPTRPDIHLGHVVVFKKLRQLQDFGCKIIFLVGDYTAQIGDPTGKSKTRPEINIEDLIKNVNTFLQQVSFLLNTEDKNKYEWLANSIWYQAPGDYLGGNTPENLTRWAADRARILYIRDAIPTFSFWNVMAVLRHITHARLIERDMFQERIKKTEHLFMHELLYPILQGIDSQVISDFFTTCDLEVGGTDQTFNMIMGRDVMKINKKEPQSVLSFKLLVGLDGKEKMSKSLNNYIAITDEPNDMYGKVMSIPDMVIAHYFELATEVPLSEIEKIKTDLMNEIVNPKDIKMRLAREIVAIYHSKGAAEKAEMNFTETFSKGGKPENFEEISVVKGSLLSDILVKNKIVASKTEFTRLIKEGAISDLVSGEKITDPKTIVGDSGEFKIGKRRFIKITLG